MRRLLVLPLRELPPLETPEVLPERRAVTELYRWMRVCERFGLDWRTQVDPADRAVMLEYGLIRDMEDAERDSGTR